MPERDITVYVKERVAPDFQGYLNRQLAFYRRWHLESYTQNNITVTASKTIHDQLPNQFTLTISSPTASERALYIFSIDLCERFAYDHVIELVNFTPGGRRSRRKSRRSKSRRSKSRRSRR